MRVKGKSLSLICGSLTWLREYKAKLISDRIEDGIDGDTAESEVIMHELTLLQIQMSQRGCLSMHVSRSAGSYTKRKKSLKND